MWLALLKSIKSLINDGNPKLFKCRSPVVTPRALSSLVSFWLRNRVVFRDPWQGRQSLAGFAAVNGGGLSLVEQYSHDDSGAVIMGTTVRCPTRAAVMKNEGCLGDKTEGADPY